MNLPLHEALGITRPAVFATVGGGGKTTVLFALAAEWEAAGGIEAVGGLTVLTTTTRMTIPREGRTMPLAIGRDDAFRAGALDDIRSRGLSSAVVGSGRGDRERVLAVAPSWPRQAVDAGLASLVGVEADGSRGRPFKAPAAHEPIIPEGVDVVAAVIGAGVLGRPLDERSVHRPEVVAKIAAAEIGDEVTPQLAARVLMSPEGGRKGVPESAEFVVLVSGAGRDLEGSRALASEINGRVVLWDAGSVVVRLT
ncbi:MAG: selenium cofactor biosynthesis protein YqeC [Chloroflexi bacterium]|nr:selenium cofactor biosynthesis protein YqeC [Chloroflexota bacterium]MCY3588251.1 selenium cofactor biosynthesis protein YqeC [Chloroflexota bacterium]MCY3684930.1 selenium cofactor biosynthesis protein YqeC [Chloroflexota bacterium]MDE2707584.1 selenium cofactor biosynthesis protein YqeC [Chloroflexota bacterium]